MPSKSQSQRGLIFSKRRKYGSESNTPKKWKWIWEEGWENKGKLPKKKNKKMKNENTILKFGNFINEEYVGIPSKESGSNVIKHYFVRQQMEVKGISRKKGNGDEIIVNGIGVINEIKDFGDDIGYAVEFPISMEHGSPYGSKWTNHKNTFFIFHDKDAENIVRVF